MTIPQSVRITLRSKIDGDKLVFAAFWEGDAGPNSPQALEVCRVPAALVVASGMKKELADLLAKMLTASMEGLINRSGGEVTGITEFDPNPKAH